jgi:uncharacterized membrane protein YfcA
VAGALAGATLGKMVDGQHLLAAFAVMMAVVAIAMLRRREPAENRGVRLDRTNAPRLILLVAAYTFGRSLAAA